MSRKRKPVDISRLFEHGVCAFCGKNDEDEIKYGKFIETKEICLHENCLFLSSGLSQGAEETEGYYGFILSDIEKELQRSKKLFCSYCKKRGASIGCCDVKCKKSFHLDCGISHGCLNQFFGSFSSYCKIHRPDQKKINIPDDAFCHICVEHIAKDDYLNFCIYSPCCKNSFFHKICLQKYALSAGLHFFKCPICNNSAKFKQEMEKFGIRIPERDASWELEENAYHELLTTNECGAEKCMCEKGRKFRSSEWPLLICHYCGSEARHKLCDEMFQCESSASYPTKKGWLCRECKHFDLESPDVVISSDC